MSSGLTSEDARHFWLNRPWQFVLSYPGAPRKNNQRLTQIANRDEQEKSQRAAFLLKYGRRAVPNSLPVLNTKDADDLYFWISYCSWTYCEKCRSLVPEKLLPGFTRRKQLKPKMSCSCRTGRYTIPSDEEIPLHLLSLTEDDVRILRPFVVHCGDYTMHKNGYRERTGPFRISWSTLSVIEKIKQVRNTVRHRKLLAAYEVLLSMPNSTYGKFVTMQRSNPTPPYLFEIYSAERFRGIECALWPTLYYDLSLCESAIEGTESRESGKVAFLAKCYSSVADYHLNYELLHYQYDRWLFRTITGAINSGRITGCSPALSLQHKTFSTGYWQWQHRMLIDAVRQFGYPSFFITISPFEWTFPFPPWLQTLRQHTGCGPTDLPVLETIHIAHTLEQLVRGYLCGSNTARWRNHLFSNQQEPEMSNVVTYFYRFEFQQRGTVHLHMLVWLQEPRQIRSDLLSATIPWQLPNEAFLVDNRQKSDSSVLAVDHGPDRFEETRDGARLIFHHTEQDRSRNIRAFVAPLLAALSCRTDIQCTDGNGMVLKYVASYVSKWRNASLTDSLYSTEVTGFQAACTFLRSLHPLEPEMALQLANIKLAWSNSRTKRIIAPTPQAAETHKSYQKYLKRDKADAELTFLQWLRAFNDTAAKPTKYRSGETLVGVKSLSVFNPVYFYQYLAMNYAYIDEAVLHHQKENELPQSVKFFARADQLDGKTWDSKEAVQNHLAPEAHKTHFVETVCYYLSSLHDIYKLWQLKVIDAGVVDAFGDKTVQLYPLSPQQTAIFSALVAAVRTRADDNSETQRTSILNPMSHNAEIRGRPSQHHIIQDTSEDEAGPPVPPQQEDWRTLRVILGKPGTGKSQVIIRVVHECFTNDFSCLVVTPVALLANHYRDLFGRRITSNTLHSVFRIPVGEAQQHTINFSLGSFDIMVIDEASMVSRATFDHIGTTLSALKKRPVVLIAGDKVQQQPLGNHHGRVVQLASILNDGTLTGNCVIYKLYRQFRCVDAAYSTFLDHIRYWQPTQEFLDRIQHGRIISATDQVTDLELWENIKQEPTATILTVSR